MSDTLATVLADATEEANMLMRNRASFAPERVLQLVREVRSAASEFLTWVSENDAMTRSGHGRAWFRQRFPDWQRQGNARWNPQRPRERQYRQLIVPIAHDVDTVQADARRTAQEASR